MHCTQSCLFMSYRLGTRFHERKKITSSISGILYCFKDNRMKVDLGRNNLLVNNTKESFQIKIANKTGSNSKYEKLGVKVNHELISMNMSHRCARRLARN